MLIPRRFNSRSGKDLGFIYRSFPSPPLVLLNPKAINDFFTMLPHGCLPRQRKDFIVSYHTTTHYSFRFHRSIEDFCAGWLTLIFRVRFIHERVSFQENSQRQRFFRFPLYYGKVFGHEVLTTIP